MQPRMHNQHRGTSGRASLPKASKPKASNASWVGVGSQIRGAAPQEFNLAVPSMVARSPTASCKEFLYRHEGSLRSFLLRQMAHAG
jgi:hypothetical protein